MISKTMPMNGHNGARRSENNRHLPTQQFISNRALSDVAPFLKHMSFQASTTQAKGMLRQSCQLLSVSIMTCRWRLRQQLSLAALEILQCSPRLKFVTAVHHFGLNFLSVFRAVCNRELHGHRYLYPFPTLIPIPTPIPATSFKIVPVPIIPAYDCPHPHPISVNESRVTY